MLTSLRRLSARLLLARALGSPGAPGGPGPAIGTSCAQSVWLAGRARGSEARRCRAGLRGDVRRQGPSRPGHADPRRPAQDLRRTAEEAPGDPLEGDQADRLHRPEGMGRGGMAVQGKRQRREVLHGPQLSVPRIHPQDHAPERPEDRRHPLGDRLRPGRSAAAEPERYLLHKRDKGNPGTDLKSLVYVRSIQLGARALEEGKRKAAGPASPKAVSRDRERDGAEPVTAYLRSVCYNLIGEERYKVTRWTCPSSSRAIPR